MFQSYNLSPLRERALLVFIVLGGLALRFLVIALYGHTPESDELAYQSMALNLISGSGVIDHMGNRAMYNAGYPLFVLTPSFLLAANNLFAARILNAILGGIAIFLCYGVAKEAGASSVGRLLAAVFWAVYLPSITYTVYLAKENLMIPLMLLVVLFALRLMRNPSHLFAVGCGVCLGLLALTGNSGIVLIFVAAFAVFLSSVDIRVKFSLILVVTLSMLAITSPWVIRNWMVLGSPVLNTNSGFNLYLGNNPSATGRFISIADTPQASSWEELRSHGEIVASKTLTNEALSWLIDNPSKFFNLALKKAVYFWTPPVHLGEREGSNVEVVARMTWVVQFFLFVGIAVGTIFCSELRARNALRVLWFSVLGYTAVHMIFYVVVRYRLPIMPFICIMAALAIESILRKYCNRAIVAPMRCIARSTEDGK